MKCKSRIYLILFLLLLFTPPHLSMGRTLQESADRIAFAKKVSVDKDFEVGLAAGNKSIPELRKVTENYTRVDSNGQIRVASFLALLDTKEAADELLMMYQRPDSPANLMGACGLAIKGQFPGKITQDHFLIKKLRAIYALSIDDWDYFREHLYIPTILFTLSYSGDKATVPYLIEALNLKPRDAIDALARLGAKEAVPDILKNSKPSTYPLAFRAALYLGDKNAIDFAISRIIYSNSKGLAVSMKLLEELEKVTGQAFGLDRSLWLRWWRINKQGWVIPPHYQQPWDQQENVPGRRRHTFQRRAQHTH